MPTESQMQRLRNLLTSYQSLIAQEAADIERIKTRNAMLPTERVFGGAK